MNATFRIVQFPFALPGRSPSSVARIVGLAVAMVAVLFVAHARPASACMCIRPPDPVIARDRSAAVFEGQVASIQYPGGEIGTSCDRMTVTFCVSRVWKGAVGSTYTVQTPVMGSCCGASFAAGNNYLVYAYAPNQVSLCSRTALTSNAAADIAALGSPQTVWSLPAARLSGVGIGGGRIPPQIRLSWANMCGETHYELGSRIASQPNAAWTTSRVGANVTTLYVAVGKKYRVRGCNALGCGPWSNVVP